MSSSVELPRLISENTYPPEAWQPVKIDKLQCFTLTLAVKTCLDSVISILTFKLFYHENDESISSFSAFSIDL